MIDPHGHNYAAKLGGWGDVIIGDENSIRFKPAVRYRRWGDECYLAVRMPTKDSIKPIFGAGRVGWFNQRNDMAAIFYGLDAKDGMEHGGFEFEIVLGKKPDQPKIVLDIETKGIDWSFQPPLSADERRRKAIRPVNVVNSYAAYHASKSFVHAIPGDAAKYQTGKIFHLYRLKATDAKGRSTWLNLRMEDRRWIIPLPRQFFSKAAYPVIIDPTIGYTTLGGSTDNTDDTALCIVFSSTEGTANPGTAYCGSANGSYVVLGVYTYNASGPFGQTRLAMSSDITTDATLAFRSAAITWATIAGSTNYFLCTWCHSSGTQNKYDAGSATGWYRTSTDLRPVTPFPNNTASGTWNNRLSVYVDYAGAGSTPITVNDLTVDNLAGGEIV